MEEAAAEGGGIQAGAHPEYTQKTPLDKAVEQAKKIWAQLHGAEKKAEKVVAKPPRMSRAEEERLSQKHLDKHIKEDKRRKE
jgi:flagellar biosynthesis chaperone FliJ